MKRKFQIALLILTLAFIWGHSCVPTSYSASESGWVAELLTPLLGIFVGAEHVTDHFVRKLAHFTEFALLGFQLLFLLAKTKKSFLRATE